MASLPLLADLADVEDRLGRDLDASESRKAAAQLRDASVVVRNYCRRDFTAGQSLTRFRPRGNKITLPERPVISVDSVASVYSFGTSVQITPLSFWQWPGGHEIFIGDQSMVINGPTLDWSDENTWCEVGYHHGFDEVPDDIVTVVANMVMRNLVVPQSGLVDLETVGPYSTRYSGITSQGPLALSEPDRDVLNRYRTTIANTIELRG